MFRESSEFDHFIFFMIFLRLCIAITVDNDLLIRKQIKHEEIMWPLRERQIFLKSGSHFQRRNFFCSQWVSALRLCWLTLMTLILDPNVIILEEDKLSHTSMTTFRLPFGTQHVAYVEVVHIAPHMRLISRSGDRYRLPRFAAAPRLHHQRIKTGDGCSAEPLNWPYSNCFYIVFFPGIYLNICGLPVVIIELESRITVSVR